MVTSVHGASGDVWIEDGKGNSTVGQIKPVAYQVLDGNDKCIGGLYKHKNAPRGLSQSFGSIDVSDKGNLTHQDIKGVINEMGDDNV